MDIPGPVEYSHVINWNYSWECVSNRPPNRPPDRPQILSKTFPKPFQNRLPQVRHATKNFPYSFAKPDWTIIRRYDHATCFADSIEARSYYVSASFWSLSFTIYCSSGLCKPPLRPIAPFYLSESKQREDRSQGSWSRTWYAVLNINRLISMTL
jgi:hypothetical protein